jgi:hypothetical protein
MELAPPSCLVGRDPGYSRMTGNPETDSPPVFANIDGTHGRLVLLVLPAMLHSSSTTELTLSPRPRVTVVITPILITYSSDGAGV